MSHHTLLAASHHSRRCTDSRRPPSTPPTPAVLVSAIEVTDARTIAAVVESTRP
ncbi:hypothetical protein [Streptomyces johnsoniae]|uniref:Uncharacterized protein n=1 Tax=Streptomyces johnsoniae TaxID=3075532 RepID=A0ABU2S4X3_9ACTN|nr:hypothetical protein [Streptomyces sp. DSM 41886]MDT0443479.1 hypothetical protein [Streptomyces sp. DSM 41886]